jgi:hypothetical protein
VSHFSQLFDAQYQTLILMRLLQQVTRIADSLDALAGKRSE